MGLMGPIGRIGNSNFTPPLKPFSLSYQSYVYTSYKSYKSYKSYASYVYSSYASYSPAHASPVAAWRHSSRGRAMSQGFIPKHGGFETLLSYQKTLIIFLATSYLAEKWVRLGSRTRDQMEQSARSGKQNIVEGSLASATSKQTEIHLTNVARASIGELHEDFTDFLRQRQLPIWAKDDPRMLSIRALGTKQAAYENYQPYIECDDPETVGNVMLCLCSQAGFLLDQQMRELERAFLREGGIRERMTRARQDAFEKPPPDDIPNCPVCGKPMRQRTARQGPNAGSPFWGCTRYPVCRGIRKIEKPKILDGKS